MDVKDFGFELGHIGINQTDAAEAKQTVAILTELFGFPTREADSSTFVNEQFEIMKLPFRGRLGHFSIRTDDAAAARAYLEGKGIVFDESSASYDENGRLKIVYARDDIAGFAFHLAQK